MNRLDHLLTILIEECAEVQKATTKILRFGLKEGHDPAAIKYGNNLQKLHHEINDVFAMVEMLQAEGLDLFPDHTLRKQKKDKVEKYLLYSKECGTLNEVE